jgi:glycosyltransferase involved in cell wall biosynthesis
MMLVSVVVPAYNEEKYIGKCMDALIRQEHPGFDVEIIVVDNNSADRTGDIAQTMGARVVVQRRQGIAWARQAGFEAAGGEIVASTDADSTPPPDWLALLVAALVKDSKALGVYGPLRVLDGARWEDLAQCYLVGAVMWLGAAVKHPTFCGPNFAVRRAAWLSAGGFDTDWLSAEDVNLSLKLARLGKVAFHWDIQVPTSARRRSMGIGPLMRHSIANYLRVVWLKQPPLPAENFR